MGDNHTVAALHLSAKNTLAGILLGVEADGGTLEVPQTLVYAGRLHHAAVLGDVAEEHGQTAILRVGMLNIAYAAVGTVKVE